MSRDIHCKSQEEIRQMGQGRFQSNALDVPTSCKPSRNIRPSECPEICRPSTQAADSPRRQYITLGINPMIPSTIPVSAQPGCSRDESTSNV